MDTDIDKLIIDLQTALSNKYGRHFKKFYLTKGMEENEEWQGLIHYSNEGERQVEYYNIENEQVVKDEKLFH